MAIHFLGPGDTKKHWFIPELGRCSQYCRVDFQDSIAFKHGTVNVVLSGWADSLGDIEEAGLKLRIVCSTDLGPEGHDRTDQGSLHREE